jgi:hypothetical protein
VATIAFLISLVGLAGGAVGFAARSTTLTATAPCSVTAPTRTVSPDGSYGPDGFNYGTTRLRVQLWPRGILRAGILPDGGSYATIDRDGSIRAKVGWWVRNEGVLSITGQRLDRSAPPLSTSVRASAGAGFRPTSLTFPTAGCWRVVGKAGTARLTFVVNVTKLQ